jgi:hypothetical protein
VSVVMERYRSAKRAEKGRILDELCATTGWHRKHAVRALRRHETVTPGEVAASRERRRRYGATTKDALTRTRVGHELADMQLIMPGMVLLAGTCRSARSSHPNRWRTPPNRSTGSVQW